jgi:hypothetical protein
MVCCKHIAALMLFLGAVWCCQDVTLDPVYAQQCLHGKIFGLPVAIDTHASVRVRTGGLPARSPGGGD